MTLTAHGPVTRQLTPGTYELRAGAKLKALLEQAGLPRGSAVICMIEGRRVAPSERLADGQTVTVLQLAAGG